MRHPLNLTEYPHNLDIDVDDVARLVHHVSAAAVQVVLQPQSLIDADGVVKKIRPISLDGSPPVDGIPLHGLHEPQIVHHHTTIGFPDGLEQLDEGGRPFPPQLEFTADPVLPRRAVPLPGLVIDADEGIRLRGAKLHRLAFAALHDLLVVASTDILLPTGVLDDLVDVQGTSVVVIGHIQLGEVHPLGQDGGKKALPLVPRQGGEDLESPAAMVVDGDGVEVQPVLVSPGPLGLLPGQRAQSQKLRHLVGGPPTSPCGYVDSHESRQL